MRQRALRWYRSDGGQAIYHGLLAVIFFCVSVLGMVRRDIVLAGMFGFYAMLFGWVCGVDTAKHFFLDQDLRDLLRDDSDDEATS